MMQLDDTIAILHNTIRWSKMHQNNVNASEKKF